MFGRKKQKYLAICEYWIYLPGDDMPEQDAIMTRMISGNPHAKQGRSPIGAREGLLFSDIRLHLSVVLRSKNPHVFRPDLFGESLEPTPEILEALSASKCLVRARYISEEPLEDHRHLQFMPHLADAIAALAEGNAIYDVTSQRLFLPEEFSEKLDAELNVEGPNLHLRSVWVQKDGAGHAETRGMLKKGIPELVTGDVDVDQQVLVKEVLQQAAENVWRQGSMSDQIEVSCFDDSFRLELQPARKGQAKLNILRIQAH